MAETKNVVFALQDVTLHEKKGEGTTQFGDKQDIVEARALRAGETFPLAKLASYQQAAAEKGELVGCEVLSPSAAKERTAEIEKYRAMLQGAGVVNADIAVPAYSGPDGNDGSHSDHEVSPEDRRAAHDGLAEASADTGGTKGKSK